MQDGRGSEGLHGLKARVVVQPIGQRLERALVGVDGEDARPDGVGVPLMQRRDSFIVEVNRPNPVACLNNSPVAQSDLGSTIARRPDSQDRSFFGGQKE